MNFRNISIDISIFSSKDHSPLGSGMRLGTNTVSSSTKFKEDFVFPSKIHILHYWKQERLYMLKGRAAVRFLKIGTPKVMTLLVLKWKCLEELQIRGDIEDNSKIIFLISEQKHIL